MADILKFPPVPTGMPTLTAAEVEQFCERSVKASEITWSSTVHLKAPTPKVRPDEDGIF